METVTGMTAELYKAVVAVVDERMREIRVTREDFDALRDAVSGLAQAQARTETRLGELAQAQARTEARLEELAQAQARTETRLGELAQAQARTEARLEELAQAQARTEARLGELAQAQARTETRLGELAQAQARTEARVGGLEQAMEQLAQAQARTEARVGGLEQAIEQLAQAQIRTEKTLRSLAQEVGALSQNIGYGLEDIARVVLPGYLERRYKIKVARLERRLFRVDGEVVDFDLYGEGSRDGKPIVVLGEVKSRIYGREVGQFLARLSEVRSQVEGEVVPLMFGYFVDLSAAEAAGEEVLLVASYQPAVEM